MSFWRLTLEDCWSSFLLVNPALELLDVCESKQAVKFVVKQFKPTRQIWPPLSFVAHTYRFFIINFPIQQRWGSIQALKIAAIAAQGAWELKVTKLLAQVGPMGATVELYRLGNFNLNYRTVKMTVFASSPFSNLLNISIPTDFNSHDLHLTQFIKIAKNFKMNLQARYSHDDTDAASSTSTAPSEAKAPAKQPQKESKEPSRKANAPQKQAQQASKDVKGKKPGGPGAPAKGKKGSKPPQRTTGLPKNRMTKKFAALMDHNKKEFNFEEIRALYKTQQKQVGNKPPVIRFSEVMARITKPQQPLIKRFYEKPITDLEVIEKGMREGKLVKGRIYFKPGSDDKQNAFVSIPGISNPIRVRGIRFLNRALHMDEVLLRLIAWTDWVKGNPAETQSIDFEEHLQYTQEAAGDKPGDDGNEDQEVDQEPVDDDQGVNPDQNDADDTDANQDQDNPGAEAEYEYYGEYDGEYDADAEYYGEEYYGEQDDATGEEEKKDGDTDDPKAEAAQDDYYDYEYYGNEDVNEVKDGGQSNAQADDGTTEDDGAESGAQNDEVTDADQTAFEYYDEEDYGGESVFEPGDLQEAEYGEDDADEDEEEDDAEEVKDSDTVADGDVEHEQVPDQDIDATKEEVKLEAKDDSAISDPPTEPKASNPATGKSNVKAQGGKNAKSNSKVTKQQPVAFQPPVILNAPKITSVSQLMAFFQQEKVAELRPLAKVVGITHSIKKPQTHSGLLKRIRIGQKDLNNWKQVVVPDDTHLPNMFMLNDQKLKELKSRPVDFTIGGWKEKWPLAKIASP